MTGDVPSLDPMIHQTTRLQIMGALFRNREMGFTDLRDGLGLTPGNLGSHMAKLEEAGYVRGRRVIVDLSFELHYVLTDEGAAAFRAYAATLLRLVGASGVAGAAPAAPASEPV